MQQQPIVSEDGKGKWKYFCGLQWLPQMQKHDKPAKRYQPAKNARFQMPSLPAEA
jgi:hypothetical protein